ncbi:MAG: enoyl-CoA hydratase, partial [Rhodospirillaceae bacterium]|nr:enoyl-CoA hydratase [Rhodospirillaceae bacterium]
MNTSAPFITEIAGGIATVTLQRPEIHNAFDDDLINRLTREFQGLGRDTVVRAVVLAAKGKSFSAGANVNWMKRMAEYGQEENLEDAKALAGLMFTLASLRKPTIAAVQGSAFGGGGG